MTALPYTPSFTLLRSESRLPARTYGAPRYGEARYGERDGAYRDRE